MMSIWLLVKPCPSIFTHPLTMTTMPNLNQATWKTTSPAATVPPFFHKMWTHGSRGFSVYSIGDTVTGFNATGRANWNWGGVGMYENVPQIVTENIGSF